MKLKIVKNVYLMLIIIFIYIIFVKFNLLINLDNLLININSMAMEESKEVLSHEVIIEHSLGRLDKIK